MQIKEQQELRSPQPKRNVFSKANRAREGNLGVSALLGPPLRRAHKSSWCSSQTHLAGAQFQTRTEQLLLEWKVKTEENH